jgi:hypothetical protein
MQFTLINSNLLKEVERFLFKERIQIREVNLHNNKYNMILKQNRKGFVSVKLQLLLKD